MSEAPPQASDEASTSDRLGPYRLLQSIGAGGMGEVFLAEREGAAGIAKRVVVKRIKGLRADDLLARERFVNEARIAMRLDHGNIVQVFDFGEDAGQLYLVMEWVDGPSLFQLGRRASHQGERIPFALSAFIVRSLLAGLHFAHEQRGEDGERLGVVHRDVSPQNVLLDLEGQVKLTDFGIARARDVISRTRPGVVRGKLFYFSPEQLDAGAVDRRTDVFAAGVVLYQLLTGSLPFKGEVPVVRRILRSGGWARASMIEPELPPQLEAVLEEAMAPVIDARFPTAAAFGDALDLWLRRQAPGTGEQDLRDYLAWIHRETAFGREAAKQLPDAYAEAMVAWRRGGTDGAGIWSMDASGTAALGGEGAAQPSRSRRGLLGLALALITLGAGALGWWQGQPPTPPSPEAIESTQTPGDTTGPGAAAAPSALEAPPEGGRHLPPAPELPPRLERPGEHALSFEGGVRRVALSVLAVRPEQIPWKTLKLARRGATTLRVEGEASLGGIVTRRLHALLVLRAQSPHPDLRILRPDRSERFRGRGLLRLAICDGAGVQDNAGLLTVRAISSRGPTRRVRVDARRDVFRADTVGGITFVGLSAAARYRLTVEGPAELPPILWVHSLQAGAAMATRGNVDGAMGLLRPGKSATFFGAETISILAITANPGTLHLRLRVSRLRFE